MLHIPGDVRDAIAFCGRAFGATTGWSTPVAADMVAQLLVHGAEFWVHPAAEEIGNPYSIPAGFDVQNTFDGVVVDKNARTIAYYVRGFDGNYTPIPRGQMLHWYKPHSVNQTRGITDLAQAVNPLVDIYELKKLATRSAKAQLLSRRSRSGSRRCPLGRTTSRKSWGCATTSETSSC